jgi:hypothetical protein
LRRLAKIESIAAGERDDLKELLTATLQRLETVDDVVRRAGMANAALEDQVQCLRCERDNAKEAAAAARERADTLLKSQRRIEWQNKVSPCLGWSHQAEVCE